MPIASSRSLAYANTAGEREVAKQLHLNMRINAQLRAKLQGLADEDDRTLTNLVEKLLWQIISTSEVKRENAIGLTARKAALKKVMDERHQRTARLSIRINTGVKERLHRLARRQRLTLTDFLETEIYMIAGTAPPPQRNLQPRQRGRTARTAIAVDPDLKVRLRCLADQDHRTLVDFIEVQLRKIAFGLGNGKA
jgi:predicted transcriptional regulator